MTAAEVLSIVASGGDRDGYAKRIRIPVLAAIGQTDGVFCGSAATDCSSSRSLFDAERRNYREAELTAYAQPRAGRNINLHEGARPFFGAVECWLDRRIPVGVAKADPCAGVDLYPRHVPPLI